MYPYVGEWHSKVVTPTSAEVCFEIEISVLNALKMHIDLLTSDTTTDQQRMQTKTVVEISNNGDARLKLSAQLSLGFQPNLTSLVQLIVYVSANVSINAVSFQPAKCSIQS
jgi:hypothetical protein